MNVISLCGAGICAVCIIMVIKQLKSDISVWLGAAASLIMTVYIITALSPTFTYLYEISSETGLNPYFTLMIKCLGTAFICQTAADICRDCGEASVAGKIELGGKAALVIQTVPVIKSLFEMAKGMAM